MTVSQSFVYKPGKTPELHDDDVADRMKADEGWFDNPKCEKSELQILQEKNAALEAKAAKKPAPKKTAAKKPGK